MLRQILLNVDLAELAARLEPEGKTELEANSVQADSETPAICGDDKDKTEKDGGKAVKKVWFGPHDVEPRRQNRHGGLICVVLAAALLYQYWAAE